jgi:hypothetical protein
MALMHSTCTKKIHLINLNNKRYYRIYILTNIFSEYELLIVRGSDKKRGINNYIYCGSLENAINKCDELLKIRHRNGYITDNTPTHEYVEGNYIMRDIIKVLVS